MSLRKAMKKQRKKSTWGVGSAGRRPEAPTGWARVKIETRASLDRVLSRSAILFPAGGGSFSRRLLTFAEGLGDLSASRPGRVVTATLALALVWWLL